MIAPICRLETFVTSMLLVACGLALSTSLPALQRNDGADAERSMARGREALAAGRFDDARSAFEEALRSRPDDARGWLLLARSRCRSAEQRAAKGDAELAAAETLLGSAEEAARKAVDLDARFAEAWAELGHVLVRGGRTDEAIATLYHAAELADPTPTLQVDLADALLAARQFALENGDTAAAAARLSDAEAALDRANGWFDSEVELLRRRAEIHILKSEPRLALGCLRRAVALRPNDSTLLESHLQLVEQTESLDEAIDYYTGLVDEPALAHWYRSRAHELRGNVALKRRRDYVAAADEYLQAERDFRASARLDGNLKPAVDAYLPTLRGFRGHALTLAEKFPEAEAALLSALDLDPRHAESLRLLHELQDAMWKKFGGESMPREKWDEIRGFASKACTVEPENAENWNNWGYFAREAGKYEESYLAYRRSLALDPKNARYLNDTALILLYHLDRDLDRAQTWLEEAIVQADAGIKDDARATSRRKEDETTLADAYGNLINLLQGTDRKDQAIAKLRDFEQRMPKRTEVDYWKQKLLPDEWKAEQERIQAEAEAKKKAADEKASASDDTKPPEGGDESEGG